MSMPVYIIDLGTEAYTFDFSFSVVNPSILDFNNSVVLANPGNVPRFSVSFVGPDMRFYVSVCGLLYITAVIYRFHCIILNNYYLSSQQKVERKH